jgi:signal transduction histidine kinase
VLPFPDLVAVIATALVCAAIVGALGLLVLRLTRRRSMLVQLCVIVASPVVAVVAGLIAVAQAMYISPHDLTVAFWITGVAAVMALGVALVLGRAFARDSRRLRELTRALGDGARVERAATKRESTEFAALAADLADTSRRLAEARDEVAALDSSRRELVAWISHDLRTPLAGLRAMAEALEDGMADDPQRFHRQMRAQVDRLSAMVDDLFELSKIHSGTLALSMEQFSLYDLVSDAVAGLADLARARGVVLREAGARDVMVTGDPRELARVVGNLVTNAIQHTPAGGEISVRVERTGDEVVLSVQDAGGGIPEGDLSRIFQAGWRGTPARTPAPVREGGTGPMDSAGAGLGLAIVQGIVHAHAGLVSVQNIPGGCRFDVRLPRHVAASA